MKITLDSLIVFFENFEDGTTTSKMMWKTGRTYQNLSNLVKTLEVKSCLTMETNGRVKNIHLTEKGVKLRNVVNKLWGLLE